MSVNEHPIALELVSLKTALDKYQHVAHTSSLQLQRARFDASEAAARSKILEADNARLQQEINLLRDHPDATPTSLPVSELTLALRRMSDKLSHTEHILLERSTELTHSLSENSRIQLEIKAAHAQLDRAHQREEAWRQRERELELRCKAIQEEARMADMVVLEYADLVRSLEGRRSKASPADASIPNDPSPSSSIFTNGDPDLDHQARSDSLVQSVTENRFSLQRLLHEFNLETSHLQAEITRLYSEISSVQANLNSERENSKADRVKLAEALSVVDRHRTDDGAAAKIVSRYMQFSQSSINMLQSALSTAKSRHAATLATVSSASEALSESLTVERKRASRLRDALDELTEDISRETFGRRREISLRLQSLVREEKTVTALGAWVRQAQEKRPKVSTPVATDFAGCSQPQMDTTSKDLETTLDHMIQDALKILASLSYTERIVDDIHDNSPSERIILAEEMVRSLTEDLEKETEKRMKLTRQIAEEMSILPPTSLIEPASAVPVQYFAHSSSSHSIDPSPSGATTGFQPATAVSILDATPASTSLDTDLPSIETGTQSYPRGKALAHTTRQSQTEQEDEMGASPGFSDVQESIVALDQPFLNELTRVSHRYDHLQRAFHDCHLALAKLKTEVTPLSFASQSGNRGFHNVVRRLDDFCEDTRVELEIRIADEERIAKGFETLLGVPGALTSSAEKDQVELELTAFLNGTTPSIVKATKTYTSKLDDLQHDIARVKLIMHESIEATSEAQPQTPPKTPPGWSSWAPPFLSGPSSRPSSPAPSFGTVITSPRPRRISSNSLLSLPSKATSESRPPIDPYAHLGLRIPMPSQIQPPSSPLQLTSPRMRKTSSSSSMYLLGLGSRSAFFSKQEPIAERAFSSSQDHEEVGTEIHNGESDVE